jgi:hypothetical protein
MVDLHLAAADSNSVGTRRPHRRGVPAPGWPRPAGGAGQGVMLGVLAQVGYAGLGQVVAGGGVHRGFLGSGLAGGVFRGCS